MAERTLREWDNFMNGYRDPLSKAEHKRIAEELLNGEDADFWEERYGGGGMNTGGEGERECGFRKEGGTYAVCPTSKNGKPIEYFIVCKPKKINRAEYNIKNIGVNLVDVETGEPCPVCGGTGSDKDFNTCKKCGGSGNEIVTHVFDVVGADNYPNVADFLEEVKRLGVSRRMELETPEQYARLTKKSRLVLLHSKAVIENPFDILKGMQKTERIRLNRAGCPKDLTEHTVAGDGITETSKDYKINPSLTTAPGCGMLYWNVIEGGEVIGETNPEMCLKCKGVKAAIKCLNCNGEGFIYIHGDNGRFVERKLACGTYRGYTTPEDIKIKYELGIFAIFPLARIEVVDPNGEFEDRAERAAAAGVDVEVTDC